MQRNGTFAIFLAATLAGTVRAQAPAQGQPEIAAHDEPVNFSSRVNLVSVPVVVRDHSGQAIGHLKQEDFQLFDKGKSQIITKFSVSGSAVETPPSAPPAPSDAAVEKSAQPALPASFIVYLVDDVHLAASDLLQTRQAMNRRIDEALDSASRGAILTTSGQTLSDFTGDRDQLHKAVNSLQPWNRGTSPEDCPPISYSQADLLTNQLMYFGSLPDWQIATLFFGSGDKVLKDVLNKAQACSHLAINYPPPPPPPPIPPPPPPPEPLVDFVAGAVRQALESGDRDTELCLHALNDAIRRLSTMPGGRSLVLASPGFLLTFDHRIEESDIFDRALRANVVINTIDMRGVFAVVAGGDASQSGYSDDAETALHTADVLAEFAEATGGTFFHNDNNLSAGLKLVAGRPAYAYILGFSPDGLKYDGSYHALKVTLKNSAGLSIQSRRGYWAPKHAADPAEEAKQRLQDVFFSNEDIPGIPLEVQTSFFKSTDDKFALSVNARLDIKTLRFKKNADRNDNTLTVVAGLFDANGKNIAATRKVIDLRLRDQSLAVLQNTGIRMKENFSVTGGRYTVRVVVADSEGQSITAHNGSVQIP